MGRPLLCVCASKNCDAVSQSADDKQKGVYFDLQELIFAQKLKRSSNTQVGQCVFGFLSSHLSCFCQGYNL